VVNHLFFDTSILIQGFIEFGSVSRSSQELMGRVADGKLGRPSTAYHCCLEFFAVTTRLPEEYRLSPTQALELLEGEIFSRFEVRQLSESKLRTVFARAVTDRVAGGRIYDAHIAEVARGVGAKIVVTENVRHFSALERDGIEVLSAAEFAGRR
jgi:hypothetical protein